MKRVVCLLVAVGAIVAGVGLPLIGASSNERPCGVESADIIDGGALYEPATATTPSKLTFRITTGGASCPLLSYQVKVWDDDNPVDLDGHGTHVAGTIGELTNNGMGLAGVAFNVKLMPVKVIDSDWDQIFGSPHEGTDDVVARGIRYAADNGAKVINMSIGRTGPPAPVIEDAIKYAVAWA